MTVAFTKGGSLVQASCILGGTSGVLLFAVSGPNGGHTITCGGGAFAISFTAAADGTLTNSYTIGGKSGSYTFQVPADLVKKTGSFTFSGSWPH